MVNIIYPGKIAKITKDGTTNPERNPAGFSDRERISIVPSVFE
jgi:hypothetical protein